MSVRSGQPIAEVFTVTGGSGAANADSLPTAVLVVNGTDNGATVTVTNRATGDYKAAVTLPTLAIGDRCGLLVTAVVSGVTYRSVVWRDSADTDHVWYVATTGNNSNPGTYGSPKLTIAGAISAADSGDKIRVLDGSFSGAVNTGSKALTIEGNGPGNTTVSYTSGVTVTVGSGCTLRGMTINATADATLGQGVVLAEGAKSVTLDQLVINASLDGLAVGTAQDLKVTRCVVNGTYDAVLFSTVTDFLIENCVLFSDGTYTTNDFGLTYYDARAFQSGACKGIIRNSHLTVTRAVNATGGVKTNAFNGTGDVTLENVFLRSTATHGSYTGSVRGLDEGESPGANKRIILKGVQIVTSSAGSGAVYDISNTLGSVLDNGAVYSDAKVNGNKPKSILASPDFTNLRQATGATTLTNLTVPTVTNVTGQVVASNSSKGAGANLVTIPITVAGSALGGASVWVTNDAAGLNVEAGTLVTNNAGQVTFLLNAGSTYYLWMRKTGYNPIVGQSFVAVAD